MMMTPRKRQAGLTEREKQLKKLALKELSNLEISEIMGVSEQTIKNELKIIYDKMKIKNKTELINKFNK
jgi:LuxR family maltose regulon positive regulatory protein